MGIASLIFGALREMDREADASRDGHPTGLNWYGGFARPDLERPQTEPCWSLRLAELLTLDGYPAEAEVAYPPGCLANGGRCDVVVSLPEGGKLWLEVKGAWKTYWRKRRREGIYRSYLLHPLVAGLDEKTHTVPKDLAKLVTVRAPEATKVGVLLVGCDSDEYPMDADVAELVHLAKLDAEPWETAQDEWKDPYRPDERVRCWLWRRPATCEADTEVQNTNG